MHLPGAQAAPLRFAFDDASAAVSLAGEGRRPGHYNFYLGRDPARWRARVPSYGELRYRGLYEGVDVRVHAQGGRPTYDLVLSPGADLGRVVVRCDG